MDKIINPSMIVMGRWNIATNTFFQLVF